MAERETSRWPWLSRWPNVEAQMDKLSRDIASIFSGGEAAAPGGEWAPAVDLHEGDDVMELTASLPGVARDGITIDVDDDFVEIRGEKRSEREEADEGYRVREIAYGAFYRRVPLPVHTNPAAVTAEFRDGLLTVRMPKRPDATSTPTRVTVT